MMSVGDGEMSGSLVYDVIESIRLTMYICPGLANPV